MGLEIIQDLGIKTFNAGYRKRMLLVRCQCGKEFKVPQNAIRTKNTQSCGCGYHRKKPISNSKIYRVLQDMKKRCFYPRHKHYHNYGGRGITVCDEWMNDSSLFIEWALENGYKNGLYIDRINPNGNYSPENCRFVDATLNATNTRLLSRRNNSGFRGVSKHKKRNGDVMWRARITYKGKVNSLGVYLTKEEAAIAFNEFVINNKTDHPLNNIKKRTN